jgi:AcrR family transcriptional regulator
MPVQGRTKREVLTEFRMAELVAAARRVFSERGFPDATMEEIAKIAGVSKGTIYLYYPSKRAAYWAALEQDILAMIEATRQSMETAANVEAKIRTFIESKIGYFEQNRDFFKIYFSEFGHSLAHPARLRKQFRELYVRQAEVLKGALEEGARNQEIRPLPTGAAAFAICDLTRSVVVRRVLGWDEGDLPDAINFIFDLVWKGLAPGENTQLSKPSMPLEPTEPTK